MHYLVIDFETTGVGTDKTDGYRPYTDERRPLPRANYPTEVAAALLDSSGVILSEEHMVVRGAQRFDPWVTEHCTHLSVPLCESEGVPMREVLRRLAAMVEGLGGQTVECTLVAHNMQYDWDDVLVRTARDEDLQEDKAFKTLSALPRYCTCVNRATLNNGTAYYFKRIGKYIGPSLQRLATSLGVPYETENAHGAQYDVRVTAMCVARLLQRSVDGRL